MMSTLGRMPLITHTGGKDMQACAAQSGRPNLHGRARSTGLDAAVRSSRRLAGPAAPSAGQAQLFLSAIGMLTRSPPPTKSKQRKGQ